MPRTFPKELEGLRFHAVEDEMPEELRGLRAVRVDRIEEEPSNLDSHQRPDTAVQNSRDRRNRE